MAVEVVVPTQRRGAGASPTVMLSDPVGDAVLYLVVAGVCLAVALWLARIRPGQLPPNPLLWHLFVVHHGASQGPARHRVILLFSGVSFVFSLAGALLVLSLVLA